MCPKKLGVLNTPNHLSRFHSKFLSLDETLNTPAKRYVVCIILVKDRQVIIIYGNLIQPIPWQRNSIFFPCTINLFLKSGLPFFLVMQHQDKIQLCCMHVHVAI